MLDARRLTTLPGNPEDPFSPPPGFTGGGRLPDLMRERFEDPCLGQRMVVIGRAVPFMGQPVVDRPFATEALRIVERLVPRRRIPNYG